MGQDGAGADAPGRSPDSDGDGVSDDLDGCPNDPEKFAPGNCGCGAPETVDCNLPDRDGDGTPDARDGCPDDPLKIAPGLCGCGSRESADCQKTDTDHDGVPDERDGCADDPLKTAPGHCGCGAVESDDCANYDTDEDGMPDTRDDCPRDPLKFSPGNCGCDQPETDDCAPANEWTRLHVSDGILPGGGIESVAISETVALVGAPMDCSEEPLRQYVYVFEKAGGGWRHTTRLTPNDNTGVESAFGYSLAVTEQEALISAPDDNDGAYAQAGTVYVFEKTADGWRQEAKLTPHDPEINQEFGIAVALEGDTALVSSPWADGIEEGCGAVYVYKKTNGVWLEVDKLIDPEGHYSDNFGLSIALSGNTAFIGSPWDATHKWGSVHVFQRYNQTWQRVMQLYGDDFSIPYTLAYFGYSVAVRGDVAVVGASCGQGCGDTQYGGLYIYRRINGAWEREEKLLRSSVTEHGLGASAAISGDTVLATSWRDGFDYFGYAHTYARTEGNWGEESVLPKKYNGKWVNYFPTVRMSTTDMIVDALWDESGDGFDTAFIKPISTP